MKKIIALALILLCSHLESKTQIRSTDSTTAVYNFIKEWWDVPYLWGGTTKKGIDCSAFVRTMYRVLHKKDLPRTSREQYAYVTKIKREELKMGDLVFFKGTTRISHVGYYLFDNLFVHSSSSLGGVTISSLYDTAYRKIWFSQGRIK